MTKAKFGGRSRKWYASVLCVGVLFVSSAGHLDAAPIVQPPVTAPIVNPTVASLIACDYEVYELVPGCTRYSIGDIVTLVVTSPPPQETTIGGSGKCAGTKVRLLPQRPAK